MEIPRLTKGLISTVAKRAPQGSFRRGATALVGATGAAQLIQIIATPLVARLYSPADFGRLAVFSAILGVLIAVSSARYEQAIPLPEREDDAEALVLVSIVLVSVIAIGTTVCLIQFGGPLSRWANVHVDTAFAVLGGLGVLGGGLYQAASMWAVRRQKLTALASTRLTQAGTLVGVQICAGVGGHAAIGLLLADATSRTISVARLFGVLEIRRIRERTHHRLRGVTRRYLRFPLVTMWAALLNVGSLQLPSLLVASYFGASLAGQYALAFRLLGLPASLIGFAIGQTFLSKAAALRSDPKGLASLTERTTIGLLAISLPVFLSVALSADVLFPAVFGGTWALSGRIAQLLAPWFLLWLVSSPLSSLLTVREWQFSALGFTAAEFALRLASLLIGAQAGSAILAIALLSISGSAISAVSTWRFLRAGHASRQLVWRKVSSLVGIALTCFSPAAICLALGPNWLRLTLTTVGVAAYAVAVRRMLTALLSPHVGGDS